MKQYFIAMIIVLVALCSSSFAQAAGNNCCQSKTCICAKGDCCKGGKCLCEGDCCKNGACKCASGKCGEKCTCKNK